MEKLLLALLAPPVLLPLLPLLVGGRSGMVSMTAMATLAPERRRVMKQSGSWQEVWAAMLVVRAAC